MLDRAEFGPLVPPARRLEGNGAGEDSPVDLRQRDMHRQIRRPQAAQRSAPGVDADARQHHLQDRRVEGVERRSVGCVETSGKRRGVEHDVKASAIEKSAQAFERRLILEAGHKDARGRQTLVAERLGQGFDRREVVGQIYGAIEDDKRVRRARLGLEAGALKSAEGVDRNRRRGARCGADLGGEKGEARRHVIRSAFVEIAPDPLNRIAPECGGLIEARIPAPVSRQQRQLDVAPARQRRQFVDAVAPIVRAAEHARDHQPGARAYALEVEVDRERVTERRKRGDPERRPRLRGGLVGAR